MSASENDCRKAFEEWMESRSISIERDKDAWGRPKYRHSHVGAMWEGFDKGRQYQLATQSALLRQAKESLELLLKDGDYRTIQFAEATFKAIKEAGV